MARDIRQPSESDRVEIDRLLDLLRTFGVGSVPDVTASSGEPETDPQTLRLVRETLALMVDELAASGNLPRVEPVASPHFEVYIHGSNWGMRAV